MMESSAGAVNPAARLLAAARAAGVILLVAGLVVAPRLAS